MRAGCHRYTSANGQISQPVSLHKEERNIQPTAEERQNPSTHKLTISHNIGCSSITQLSQYNGNELK